MTLWGITLLWRITAKLHTCILNLVAWPTLDAVLFSFSFFSPPSFAHRSAVVLKCLLASGNVTQHKDFQKQNTFFQYGTMKVYFFQR